MSRIPNFISDQAGLGTNISESEKLLSRPHGAQGDPATPNPYGYETGDGADSDAHGVQRDAKTRASISLNETCVGSLNSTDTAWQDAQARANICTQFEDLLADGSGHSLRTAAAALGKSPSWFSGAGSMLARYRRGGVAALMTAAQVSDQIGELTAQIEALAWFIPAAQMFYLLSNRNWNRGSVPEAIRRVISLPHTPNGWKDGDRKRFLTRLGLDTMPVCPEALREACLAREKAGKPLVPRRIAKKILVNQATVRQYRNPREAALDFLNSPGGMRLFRDPATGETRLARAGEIMEADDATINFPVCVPWNRDGGDDPCVQKYGVKVARFQWLVAIDVGTGFVPGFSYTARPRSSYRGEDIVSLLRIVARAHGLPRQWRLERGAWESKLVKEVIKLMGCRLDTVYSPHQKPFIEGLFSVLWTKLSVHFPGAHVGRFRGEEKAANDLLTACQRGHKDPRRYFPLLGTAIETFHEVIAEKNRTPLNTEAHGRWVPEDRWSAELAGVRKWDGASEWMFSPFVRQWKVRGMIVGGRVPLLEKVSVPFEFSAPWLVQYDGALVNCHFDPADPRCSAMVVLAAPFDGHKKGEVLGSATLIGQAAAYARMVMGWGEDPQNAGLIARQRAQAGLRREVRAILPRGARGDSVSEERDGIGAVNKIESGNSVQTPALAPEQLAELRKSETEKAEERGRKVTEFYESNPLDFI